MLRDYQRTAVRRTLAAWKQHRAVLFVCPTGGGKTHVFCDLARREAKQGRTLILTDRLLLADQAAGRIEELTGLSVGMEQGARRIGRDLPDVVCATIQSISKPERLRRFKPSAFSLVVVDEADLGIAASYRAVLERFPKARVFGCTATPDRADGRNLGEVFGHVAHTVEMADLIRQGYLSKLRRHLVRIESVSLERVSKHDGDFTDAALQPILTQERALHEVVRPTLDLAGKRPTLVFSATVAHAQALADVFNRPVYRPGSARVIHGGMSVAERAEVLAAYQRREFQFLCNCALMLRGVDLPFISCVAMARPTLSRGLYAQSIGRGTRVAPGKADLLVLDFTDNSATHDLVSPIDVLCPGASEETKERAREILDEEQGADPLEALDRAEAQLEADPALRERVRAKVAFRMEGAATAPKWIDWAAVDWTKSRKQIAEELRIFVGTVTRMRRKYAPETSRKTATKGIDWAVVDWTKSTMQIAEDLAVDKNSVGKMRRKYAQNTITASKKGIDYTAVDWTKSTMQIAEDLGVHYRSVHKARRKYAPETTPKSSTDCSLVDWNKPTAQIAAELGIIAHSVSRLRRKYAPETSRGKRAP